MEPLSLAFGIAGLTGLALELNKIISEYIGSVKHASAESCELAAELSALAHVSERLYVFLGNKGAKCKSFDNTSVLYSVTASCHDKLNRPKPILHDFMNASERRNWYRNIVWPLKKKEHLQIIKILHQCMEIFHFSLTIDGW